MATQTSEPVVKERGPPAQWLFHTILNPLMSLLLRSPLHFLVSDSLMLITFTGRKSGREYTTPVGYHEYGDGIVVFTHNDWWKNLKGGVEVTLRIAGERRVGLASPIQDPDRVADYILAFIADHGPDAARRLGLEFGGGGVPTKTALVEGLDRTVVIEIDLEGGLDG